MSLCNTIRLSRVYQPLKKNVCSNPTFGKIFYVTRAFERVLESYIGKKSNFSIPTIGIIVM